jgi:hypothetical protein
MRAATAPIAVERDHGEAMAGQRQRDVLGRARVEQAEQHALALAHAHGSPWPSILSLKEADAYNTSSPLSGGGPLRISCMLTHLPSQWWAASSTSWS